jgi:hypothetical protein
MPLAGYTCPKGPRGLPGGVKVVALDEAESAVAIWFEDFEIGLKFE